ncbi:hypothetical protein HYFRA_00006839 [Hymenoscyphus fraxineus]|uniref:Protein kinase domain-containing protein n=1 Tax=Hymenoscyphus fraxineus TaxID=746836 RepID=A0A9N9PKU9_9HELO|nr:hypothetical protein HYFRA_00006839 [Hymenoscyphus fraxineus]
MGNSVPTFVAPYNWISKGKCIKFGIYREVQRRTQKRGKEKAWAKALQRIVDHDYTIPDQYAHQSWARQLYFVRLLNKDYEFDDDVLTLLGHILHQALDIERDCARDLINSKNAHRLVFFTNYRVLQVYCCHNTSELKQVEALCTTSNDFRFPPNNPDYRGVKYHECTEKLFFQVNPYLAWECAFPEGIDMEALSPRDANAHLRKPQPAKLKPPVAKAGKEKDHPPPPPADVIEPPSFDRKHGATYRSGDLLGRGGFAICYKARLAGTRQFQTELQIHSKMRHPNIVRFHRAFAYEQCTYLVLELCPNGSLMDMVKKRKYITEPEVRFWTVQMAGAIKYMHDKGIIHRDLKMGNVFLDKDMNVKVGDFGLAALLMSGKDWSNCRRTTLCGTPNYIAPEILSKDKQGHDHAVDIWSLGIIIFAMLTGKPPFQSSTADEIYRRARELQYDWPKLNTSENLISPETKDLVAELLQPAELRPGPDAIVQHPFFTCGWFPQSEEMTTDLCYKGPSGDQFVSVGLKSGRFKLYERNLKKLCKECGVGPWDTAKKRVTSTYREVAAEEKAGLTPQVPLPNGIVYRPFDEWLASQQKITEDLEEDDDETTDGLDMVAPPALKTNLPTAIPTARPPTQSFAAQQRARPGLTQLPTRGIKARQPAAEISKTISSSTSRPILNISARLAKAKKAEPKFTEDVVQVEDRLAADLAQHLTPTKPENKFETQTMTMSFDKPTSIFSPREKLEIVPNTKPDDVLAGLRRLQNELERALNSRTMAVESKSARTIPHIVVKWVDYTNKFGLGYVLNNGTVGCIFKSTEETLPDSSKGVLQPNCLVVRDAERHLQNRGNEKYPDRMQMVPVSGHDIEFYEDKGQAGLACCKIPPQTFKTSTGKLPRVGEEYEDRKREKLVLWRKFGNYMTAFGRDVDYPYDDTLQRIQPRKDDEDASGNVITFYERWGDVGCWGFCDGHFQFNFPDHTKIVVSKDGTWCDLYHLPMDAARDLRERGTLTTAALDDRQHLSYPLQTLLNFMSKPSKNTSRRRPEIDPMIQGIPEANQFRKKIEFIKDVIKEWVTNGGLGCSNFNYEHRLRWTGHRELVNVKIPYKHVWVTVGARGGDDRKVAWFDPNAPAEKVPDIE